MAKAKTTTKTKTKLTASKKTTTVDEYLAAQPAPARKQLARVRAAIRRAAPQAEELISYGIAGYKLNGRALVYFAGWKEHLALYPASGSVVAALKKELAGYEVDKGTIRFPLSKAPPLKLIERIVRLRVEALSPARP
jgi:uncharacterized protein YdhG (YjbR/CyaY superfamily)